MRGDAAVLISHSGFHLPLTTVRQPSDAAVRVSDGQSRRAGLLRRLQRRHPAHGQGGLRLFHRHLGRGLFPARVRRRAPRRLLHPAAAATRQVRVAHSRSGHDGHHQFSREFFQRCPGARRDVARRGDRRRRAALSPDALRADVSRRSGPRARVLGRGERRPASSRKSSGEEPLAPWTASWRVQAKQDARPPHRVTRPRGSA